MKNIYLIACSVIVPPLFKEMTKGYCKNYLFLYNKIYKQGQTSDVGSVPNV